MREPKQRSIHRTLLKAHLATILTALALMAAIFFIWQQKNLQETMRENLAQTCRTVAINVDREIRTMDSVSVNILYSNLVKENFARFSTSLEERADGRTTGERSSASILADVLTAISGADRSVRQINLYNRNGGGFGMGMYNGALPQNATDQPWYDATVKMGGYKYISPPQTNPFLSRYGATAGQEYLSLCRQYFNVYNKPEGFVEVLQYYDAVFATALEPESSYVTRIVVYRDDGTILFPAHQENGVFLDYLPHYSNSVVAVNNPLSGRVEYVAYSQLPRSGFTVAVAMDSAKYFAPIFQFACTLLLVLAIVVSLCFWSVYGVTRKISAPIVGIYSYLHNLDFKRQSWKPIPMENSNIVEIDVLRVSINQFQERLQESLEKNLLLQQQELQSQMLALQSQMNPHFLYNSLATVNAMAEEGMVEEIGEMCSNITDILRYISSNKQPLVPLEEELENNDRYLRCLKLRFGESLTYTIDIPDELLEVQVPKLCVQLLVENAVKYMTPNSPPWHIAIRGTLENHRWKVSVMDTGTGFSPEVTAKINGKIAEIQKSGLLPSLELNGMGLMNIYIRFHLIYGKRAEFTFYNRKPHGAVVVIGGDINAENQTI